MSKKKIFLISFNKCATTSFWVLMQYNKIPAAHCEDSKRKIKLAKQIYQNIESNKDPLYNLNRFTAFCDFTHSTYEEFIEMPDIFDKLYQSYPDSYYIFFDRPVDKWIKSRLKHKNFLVRCMSAYNTEDKEEVINIWKKSYYEFKGKVTTHFKGKKNFLMYNIEDDNIKKLIEFLPEFKLNPKHWGVRNKTK